MDKTGHQGIQATQLEYHLNIIQDKYKKEFSDHFTENLENSLKEADLQLQNFVNLAGEYAEIHNSAKRESRRRQREKKKEGRNKMKDLNSMIYQQESNLQQIETKNEQLQTRLGQVPNQIQEHKEEISLVREAAKVINVDFYANAVKMFQDRLGLTIEKTKGKKMKLIFTRIDPNDHNKQFWIIFGIDSNTKQYYAHEIVPNISGIQSVIDQMNQSGNLRTFVKDVRNLFLNYTNNPVDELQ